MTKRAKNRYQSRWANGVILLFLAATLFWLRSTESAARIPAKPAHPRSARVPVRSSSHGDPAGSQARFQDFYGKLPMSFEANRGHADRRVKFLSRGNGYTVFLSANEAVLALQRPSALGKEIDRPGSPQSVELLRAKTTEHQNAAVLRVKLVGARAAKVSGLEELPGKSNYFIGNDASKWQTQVPTYAKVRYQEAYPGIDLIYYGHQRQLEYDFVVAPGADPRAITVRLEGSRKMRIDGSGDLVLQAGEEEVRFHKPVVYQAQPEFAGARKFVESRYVLKGAHEVAFEIAAYDSRKPLIIDPVLTYSTYLGGSGNDYGIGIAVDSAGNAYVTGWTASIDFPTANPLQPTNHGGWDVFVATLDPTGSTLLYSMYLGGSSDEYGNGIALDRAGNAYVTGLTHSTDFPTANPLQSTNHGGYDAFVAALDPTGSMLLYSTYLGGNRDDVGNGIAVDRAGNAYLTGIQARPISPRRIPCSPPITAEPMPL